MIKLTLDTNCIINLLDYKLDTATSTDVLSEITRYGLEGDVNIAITTRVQADMDGDKDDERRSQLTKRITMFPVIGTTFRADVSKLDSGDVVVGGVQQKLEQELKDIIFPGLTKDDQRYQNKIFDIDHLVGHVINGRDIFVTDDKQLLSKAEKLKASPGVTLMNPAQCLEFINLKANRKVLVDEFFEKLLQYRDLLLLVQETGNYAEKQQEFTSLRQWLLKKYPVIKDGLLQFRLNLQAVPAGPGQMVFDKGKLLGLENMNERIQILFREPDIRLQIAEILKPLYEGEGMYTNPRHSTPKDKLTDRFQDLVDLLTSYSGYLENNF